MFVRAKVINTEIHGQLVRGGKNSFYSESLSMSEQREIDNNMVYQLNRLGLN